MRALERETNLDVLRQYSLLLEAEVKRLNLENQNLKKAGSVDEQVRLENLEDQLVKLRERFFGFGREKQDASELREVSTHSSQLNLHGEYPQDAPEAKEDSIPSSDAPVVMNYKMSDRQLAEASKELGIADEIGARAWREAKGLYQEHSELTIFERTYCKALHRQHKYRLRGKYNKTDKDEVLITAPGPAKLRPGSRYSVDFAIAVVVDKYQDHLPLERQRRRMERSGVEVDVKTLYGLCEAVAGHCEAMLPRIKEDIQRDFCALHLDESPWPIMGEKKKSYMWAMSNRAGSYYQFEPTRSGKIASELVGGYEGAVVSDAFSGYKRLKVGDKTRLGHCWSHARREFYDRRSDYPEVCREALEQIGKLFAVEASAKSFEELKKLRQTKSREVVEEFQKWLLKTRAKYLGVQGISKAIVYCMNHWQELTLFLDDLSVPLTNNDAERALRHVVMGRKNFNGSKTINGADTAATLYTVIETCKKLGVEPARYWKYLIEESWFKEKAVLSPYEYAMEKLGPNQRLQLPKKEEWKIE